MRKFNLGTIKVEMNNNGFPKGLILKRDLTLRECKMSMIGFVATLMMKVLPNMPMTVRMSNLV